ncbi:oryzalexin E synthase-like [Carex rostrata]
MPKGVTMIVNVWAIGRNPQQWTELDVFRAERFLDKQISFRRKDFEFIPFGSGKKFDWRLPDGMEPKDVDMTEKYVFVLEMVAPLCAVPVPVNTWKYDV